MNKLTRTLLTKCLLDMSLLRKEGVVITLDKIKTSVEYNAEAILRIEEMIARAKEFEAPTMEDFDFDKVISRMKEHIPTYLL